MKLLSPSVISEGDMLTLLFLAKLIREQCSEKITEIIHKFCLIINSDRYSVKKRLFSIYVSGKYH